MQDRKSVKPKLNLQLLKDSQSIPLVLTTFVTISPACTCFASSEAPIPELQLWPLIAAAVPHVVNIIQSAFVVPW